MSMQGVNFILFNCLFLPLVGLGSLVFLLWLMHGAPTFWEGWGDLKPEIRLPSLRSALMHLESNRPTLIVLFFLIGGVEVFVVYIWEVALFGFPSATEVNPLLVTVVFFGGIYTLFFWSGFFRVWLLLRKLGWVAALAELLAACWFINYLGSFMRTTDWSVIYPILFFPWVEWQLAKSLLGLHPSNSEQPERIEVSLAKIHLVTEITKRAQQVTLSLFQYGTERVTETIHTASDKARQADLTEDERREFDALTQGYLFQMRHVLNHAHNILRAILSHLIRK